MLRFAILLFSLLGPGIRGSTAQDAALQDFINKLDGSIILQGQPQFNKAKSVMSSQYNNAVPLMVVYCTSEEDVKHTMLYAKQINVTFCVRAGGHDMTGSSICDSGIVLDVTRLNQIIVAQDKSWAYIQVCVSLGRV